MVKRKVNSKFEYLLFGVSLMFAVSVYMLSTTSRNVRVLGVSDNDSQEDKNNGRGNDKPEKNNENNQNPVTTMGNNGFAATTGGGGTSGSENTSVHVNPVMDISMPSISTTDIVVTPGFNMGEQVTNISVESSDSVSGSMGNVDLRGDGVDVGQVVKQPDANTGSVNTTSNIIVKQGTVQNSNVNLHSPAPVKIEIQQGKNRSAKISSGQKNLQVRYGVQQGKIVINTIRDTGEVIQIEDQAITSVDSAVRYVLNDEGVKLSTSENEQMAFGKNDIWAVSSQPINVDVEKRKLTMLSQNGIKEINVLPDQAYMDAMATGIKPVGLSEAQKIVNTKLVKGVLELKEADNKPVFELRGEKSYKLAGIWEVKTPVTFVIDADSGSASIKQDFLVYQIISWLLF